ncbi:hypothetical protein [Spirosoma linguale]|uniref:Uncharacterized protein n=1 Tax=Spirosoma linguale (strain ATCC 33905 / DSM 74 / LMG 10896 / Claus 1) TaxID=504472 RepID=D2QHF7_SPILD|nr:hypothetical protein Slin_2599 [Spirosoma linguale DSM 74]
MICFKYSDSSGDVQECSYGGPNLESGLDMLTELINHGWKLTDIRIIGANKNLINLPLNAFDGNYFSEPLGKLQQEWEDILLPVS